MKQMYINNFEELAKIVNLDAPVALIHKIASIWHKTAGEPQFVFVDDPSIKLVEDMRLAKDGFTLRPVSELEDLWNMYKNNLPAELEARCYNSDYSINPEAETFCARVLKQLNEGTAVNISFEIADFYRDGGTPVPATINFLVIA